MPNTSGSDRPRVRERQVGSPVSVVRAGDGDRGSELAHAVISEFVDLAPSGDGMSSVCARFPEVADALIADGDRTGAAVMSNMIAVVDRRSPGDLVRLSELVGCFGHRTVASAHAHADGLLETGPGSPLATELVRTLARTAWIGDQVRPLVGSVRAAEVGECCARCGFWLVLAHIKPSASGPRLDSVEDAVRCVDQGSIEAWRAQIATFAANPWMPYPTQLGELLLEGQRPTHAQALDAVVGYFRERAERRERQLVAREIRQLVAVSGRSQREFAAMVGTSAPRLSTYVNGLVTPSATMLIRMRRVSKYLQDQAAAR